MRYSSIKNKLTNVILTSNSSTTILLEAITGKEIRVDVIRQDIVQSSDIDNNEIYNLIKSKEYLKRLVLLYNDKNILSYNIVVAAYDNLPNDVKEEIFKGNIPLGKIIKKIETSRELKWSGKIKSKLLKELFKNQDFELNEYPAKKYLIYINNKCFFYLTEVFCIDTITRIFLE